MTESLKMGADIKVEELTSSKIVESSSNDLVSVGASEKRKIDRSEDEFSRAKKPRWKNRGMNKKRPRFKVKRESELCRRLVDRQADTDSPCTYSGCKFTHDVKQYMEQKLPSLGEECYVFNTRGYCPRGVTCRFGSKHVTEGGLNIVNEAVHDEWKSNASLHTLNTLNYEAREQLRKKTYKFERTKTVLDKWRVECCGDKPPGSQLDGESEDKISDSSAIVDSESKISDGGVKADVNGVNPVRGWYGPILDTDVIGLRSEEKRKIDWRGKLFLSPLTTVGNLPFRRICKEFGADVTCGEMALATCLLQGKTEEWALTKRHGSEDLFGVQVCGSKVDVMTRCAQLIRDQADVDFVDINVGCPIDLIFKQGAGSGLLNKKKVLFSIVKCMKSVLDVPLTLKTRTGIYKNITHNYIQDLTSAGVDLITVHGRTKDQRYTKLADWEYIEQCAKLAAPTPVIGNGDILSFSDYDLAKERSPSVASVMIGRGALIKPWIFTELKERRHWDISSEERFQMLQKFANYGLEHWGSDTRGVETTRRFLLEWLSFLYRYVPLGLLDGPQKMNERPPVFQGRDELEVLMASPNCADWIKISEMLLGAVPQEFQFLPKHKANSWT